MGALHAGHEALIAAARAECDHVVVSVFVNSAQFDGLSVGSELKFMLQGVTELVRQIDPERASGEGARY